MEKETEKIKYEPYVWYGVNLVLPYEGDVVVVCDKHDSGHIALSYRSDIEAEERDEHGFRTVKGMQISHWMRIEPLDLSKSKDIDWSKSVAEIDRQLYAKYDLTDEEIDFIEKNIKPME